MIICPDRKYVFIRPQRVGSTSLIAGLKQHFTPRTIYSGTVADDGLNIHQMGGHVVDHSLGHVIYKHFPAGYDPAVYKWFTVMRNPWARIHSMHKFLKNQGAYLDFKNYLVSANTLELHHWYNSVPVPLAIHKYPAFDGVCQALGMPLNIPMIARTEVSDYRDCYTEQWMVDIVAHRCAPEIELGKYTFEEGEDLDWRKDYPDAGQYQTYQQRLKDDAAAES